MKQQSLNKDMSVYYIAKMSNISFKQIQSSENPQSIGCSFEELNHGLTNFWLGD